MKGIGVLLVCICAVTAFHPGYGNYDPNLNQNWCIQHEFREIGLDIPFDRWGQAMTVNECMTECDSRPMCAAASMQPPDNRCYLHTGIDSGMIHMDAGWMLYYRNCPFNRQTVGTSLTFPNLPNPPVIDPPVTGGGGFYCPQPTGLFFDPLSCLRFYHCDNGIAYQKSCPAGLKFSEILQVCAWPYQSECNHA